MYEYIIWPISFLTLLFSFFWLLILWLDEAEFDKLQQIKYFPHITLIIPTYNGGKTIEATVKSLLNVDYPKDKLDIIVAPNNCTDNTEEIVRKLVGPRVKMKVVKVPEGKQGKAYTFNQVLSIAKGEIVGCMDDDGLIEPDAFKYMVPLFSEPKVAAVISACKVYQPKNLLQQVQSIEYVMSAFSKRLQSSVDALFMTPGVTSLFKKDILIKVGGMDETTLTEDIEIAVHLVHAGYLVRSQLRSISYAVVPETLYDFHKQRIRWARGYLDTMIKHKEMLFSTKYGLLGAFLLPLILIMAPLAIIAACIFFYSFFGNTYGTILGFWTLKSQAINLYFGDFSIFGIDPITFVIVILLASSIFLIYKSHQYTKSKWKYPLATIIFFTAYPPLLAAYWVYAILYECFGVKKTWGGSRDKSYKKLEVKA